MARPFGIGIVGTGMASLPHALALKALGDRVAVRGVWRRDAAKRAGFAGEHGFAQAESFEALLADPEVDALLVLTPPNAREAIVAAAAAAGKHVLMEKPVERTTAAAKRIVRLAEDAGITLGIVFQHRFRAGSQTLKRLLAEGSMGEVAAVSLQVPWWRPQSYYDQPGRGTLEQDGGGVLLTQAIHPLDLMLSLVGPVASVAAVAGTTRMHRMETEDFVGAGLRFSNGAIGSLSATTALFPGGAETLIVACEQATATLKAGTLTVAWQSGEVETTGEPATGVSGGGADPMAFPFSWHKAQIEDFIDAVEGHRQPLSTGRTALEVHRLIDALLQSAREERAVAVART